MHDPMTVAFEIRRPWRERPSKHFPEGYRPTWITIWHVDPEVDGTDNSCGWFTPKATDADKKLAREMVEWESKFPYYFDRPVRQDPKYKALWRISPGDCLALVIAAWQTFAWRLERRHLTPKLLLDAASVAVEAHDNFQQGLSASDPEEQYRTMIFLILAYRRARRPWWRHPRWHLRHWQLQVQPLQDLKRWLFTRCERCGERFPWGASVHTNSWHGTGPQWFRSEAHVYHADCRDPASSGAAAILSGSGGESPTPRST